MKKAGVAESWKYTNLAPVEAVAWEAPARSSAAPIIESAPYPVCGRIVFHNGFLIESAGFLPDGAHLSQDSHKDIHRGFDFPDSRKDGTSRIIDMNMEYFQDGATLTIEAGVTLSAPIEIVFLAESERPVRLAPRLAVLCEADSSVTLVERHVGAGVTLSAVRVFIEMKESVRVEHVRLESAANEAILLQTTEIVLEKCAHYRGFHYADGGRLSRNQISATLAGPEAEFQIAAVALLRGARTGDLTSFVHHAGPGARSSQQVRTVLDGPARGVYQGKISVAPGADGTDARQNSRALLLSEGAEMDTKPELEILADDVKCAHGAATGALDPEVLFYLRSRGIPESRARALLVSGFVSELLDFVSFDGVRDEIAARIEKWMGEA